MGPLPPPAVEPAPATDPEPVPDSVGAEAEHEPIPDAAPPSPPGDEDTQAHADPRSDEPDPPDVTELDDLSLLRQALYPPPPADDVAEQDAQDGGDAFEALLAGSPYDIEVMSPERLLDELDEALAADIDDLLYGASESVEELLVDTEPDPGVEAEARSQPAAEELDDGSADTPPTDADAEAATEGADAGAPVAAAAPDAESAEAGAAIPDEETVELPAEEPAIASPEPAAEPAAEPPSDLAAEPSAEPVAEISGELEAAISDELAEEIAGAIEDELAAAKDAAADANEVAPLTADAALDPIEFVERATPEDPKVEALPEGVMAAPPEIVAPEPSRAGPSAPAPAPVAAAARRGPARAVAAPTSPAVPDAPRGPDVTVTKSGPPPPAVKVLLWMNYPLRVLPPSVRLIVDWIALSLIFWVPIVWLVALLVVGK